MIHQSIRKLSLVSMLLFGCAMLSSLHADPPPPPGGGGIGGGNNQSGGGSAPIDGGVVLLLVMAAGYGSRKIFHNPEWSKK